MKVLRTLVFFLCPVLCFGARTQGNTVCDGDFEFVFDLTTKEGSLVKYTGTDSEVTIPSSFVAEESYYEDGEWKTRPHTIKVTSIGVPKEGVTTLSVPNRPFNNNTTLRRINLPETVRVIGIYAFENCLSLESIKTPTSLASLGYYAFNGCSSLKEVEINGNGTVVISSSTFYGCTALEKCIFYGVSKIYGSSTFMDSPNLREVRLGPEIRTIPSGLFSRKTNLRTVTFFSVTNIEERAFYGCSALTSVDLSSAEQIGDSAFEGCNGLDSVSTSTSLSCLGSLAFSDCANLSTAIIDGNGQLSLGKQVFIGCTNLETVVLGEGLAEIEEGGTASGMFNGCSRLRSVEVRTTKLNKLPEKMFSGSSIEQVFIAGGIKDVGNSAFYGCRALKQVTGNFNYVTNIGHWAFTDCSALTTIPSTDRLRIVGYNAFQNCSSLGGLLSLENLESIDTGAFQNCPGVSGDLILPKVVSIGTLAFAGCANLTKVITGKSLSTLGREAFSGCADLKYAKIDGNGSASVDALEFEYCQNLEECVFGDGIRKLTGKDFVGCLNLRKVTFGLLIDNIPYWCFYNLQNLQTVNWSSVTNVAIEAFYNCTNLTELSSLSTVETIEKDAFRNCSALSGILDLRSARRIDRWAFYGCKAIDEVRFSENLTSIAEECFKLCRNAYFFDFKGPPPYAGSYPFSSVKSGAIGTYSAKYKEEWEAVIEPNGTWKGLIIVANKPVLSNGGCDVAAGELTIRWDDENAPMPPGMTYEVHRGFSDDYAASEVLTNGYSKMSFVDKDFYTTGGVSRVWYWVKPEHEIFEPSDPLVTRTRHGLAVGLGSYNPPIYKKYKVEDLPQCRRDAELASEVMTQYGGGIVSPNMKLLLDAEAKREDITNAWRDIKKKLKPGDIVFFFLATHGGYTGVLAYDGLYTMRMFQNDIEPFRSGTLTGVKVVAVLMNCLSENMTSDIGDVEFEYGSMCTPNILYVAVAGAEENEANIACDDNDQSKISYTTSGEFFLNQGMKKRRADCLTTLRGIEGDFGNNDGIVDLLECSRYLGALSIGRSDKHTTHVQYDPLKRDLMKKTIMVVGNSSSQVSVPQAPRITSVTTRSNFISSGIKINWNRVANAQYYIIRYSRWGDSVSHWYVSDGRNVEVFLSTADGATSKNREYYMPLENDTIYQFSMVAVNAAGRSEEGNTVTRKTEPARRNPVYKVFFKANGGSVSPSFWDVEEGALLGDLPVPVNKGRTFLGWFTSPIGGSEINKNDVVAKDDITCYAHWSDLEIRIPAEWLRYFPSFQMYSGGDVTTAAAMTAANRCRTVGECYALGIDPEDPEDDFRITHFEMQDGTPKITLNHTKDGSGNSFEDRIKIIGKVNLDDEEWVDVVEMPKKDGEPLRFFKVKVELP